MRLAAEALAQRADDVRLAGRPGSAAEQTNSSPVPILGPYPQCSSKTHELVVPPIDQGAVACLPWSASKSAPLARP